MTLKTNKKKHLQKQPFLAALIYVNILFISLSSVPILTQATLFSWNVL